MHISPLISLRRLAVRLQAGWQSLLYMTGFNLWRSPGISSNERQALWVLLVTAVSLSLLDYLCDRQWVAQVLLDLFGKPALDMFDACCVSSGNPLGRSLYWSLVNIACYSILPLLTIRFILRRPLADFGLRREGAFQAWPIYVAMLLVMLPLVWYASASSSFLQHYPFLRLSPGTPLWPTFFIWEILYCAQFFALEFFFRGFLLHGLAPHCGRASVLIMMLPYCMLHFGKPLPETLASILAGLALGTLSLKSRSIFLGGLIHFSVALTMDGMALWRKGWW